MFIVQVHKNKPSPRLRLHFDKLHVDNNLYVVNEESDEEEELEDQVNNELNCHFCDNNKVTFSDKLSLVKTRNCI